MKTKIINIKDKIDNKGNSYKVIYFDIDVGLRFTYLTQKSLKYWTSKGVNEFKIGMTINIFSIPNSNNYKIVGVE